MQVSGLPERKPVSLLFLRLTKGPARGCCFPFFKQKVPDKRSKGGQTAFKLAQSGRAFITMDFEVKQFYRKGLGYSFLLAASFLNNWTFFPTYTSIQVVEKFCMPLRHPFSFSDTFELSQQECLDGASEHLLQYIMAKWVGKGNLKLFSTPCSL